MTNAMFNCKQLKQHSTERKAFGNKTVNMKTGFKTKHTHV